MDFLGDPTANWLSWFRFDGRGVKYCEGLSLPGNFLVIPFYTCTCFEWTVTVRLPETYNRLPALLDIIFAPQKVVNTPRKPEHTSLAAKDDGFYRDLSPIPE